MYLCRVVRSKFNQLDNLIHYYFSHFDRNHQPKLNILGDAIF